MSLDDFKIFDLRVIWQGGDGEYGFVITPEALVAINAEIKIRRRAGDYEELDYLLSERDGLVAALKVNEMDRLRPVKERIYGAIAGWGGLTTAEIEQLYPEVDSLRIGGALYRLEHDERRIGSTNRAGDSLYTITGARAGLAS